MSEIMLSKKHIFSLMNESLKSKNYSDDGNLKTKIIDAFNTHTYYRELFIPAGTLIVGRIHKTKHWNTVVSGQITVVNIQYGEKPSIGEPEAIEGFYSFLSEKECQKVVLTATDTVWVTQHSLDRNYLESEIYDSLVYNNSEMKKIIDKNKDLL